MTVTVRQFLLDGDGSYVDNGINQTDQVKYIVEGLSTVGLNPIAKKPACLNPLIVGNRIPQHGRPHRGNKNISVIRRTVNLIDGDKAEVLVSYGVPSANDVELDPGTQPRIHVGTTTVEIQTNFDIHGNPIFTNHADKKILGTVTRSEGLTSFTFRHVSEASPGQLSREWVPSINSQIIFGSDPIGSWQLTDIDGDLIPGTNLSNISYRFVQKVGYDIKPFGNNTALTIEGWQSFHVETDPSTGEPYKIDDWIAPPESPSNGSRYAPPSTFTSAFTWRLVDHYPKKDFVLLGLTF